MKSCKSYKRPSYKSYQRPTVKIKNLAAQGTRSEEIMFFKVHTGFDHCTVEAAFASKDAMAAYIAKFAVVTDCKKAWSQEVGLAQFTINKTNRMTATSSKKFHNVDQLVKMFKNGLSEVTPWW